MGSKEWAQLVQVLALNPEWSELLLPAVPKKHHAALVRTMRENTLRAERVEIRPDRDYFLLEGVVALLRDGRFERLVSAPHYLFDPGGQCKRFGDHCKGVKENALRAVALEVAGEKRATFTSVSGASLESFGLARDAPALCAIGQRWAQSELQRVHEERMRLERGQVDLIDPVDGELRPGPYELEAARLVYVVVEDPAITSIVPQELRGGLFNDRYMIVFADYPMLRGRAKVDAEALAYRETTIFVPVTALSYGGPGLFCPELYPDNLMAIVVGREIYSFPKRYGETGFLHDPATHLEDGHVVLVLDGELKAHVAWEGATELPRSAHQEWFSTLVDEMFGKDWDALAFSQLTKALIGRQPNMAAWLSTWNAMPVFLHHRRADLTHGKSRDELVRVPFELLGINKLRRAELTSFDLSLDGLAGGTPVGVWVSEVDMRLNTAEIVADRGKGPGAFVRRTLGRARGIANMGRSIGEAALMGGDVVTRLLSGPEES